jgi:superfamily II DNA or RNA helicase
MAHEGLDINRLDTVILTTPKRNVVQAIGRIMRKILTETDLKPLIIDLTDNLSVFNNQGETRYRLYKKNNYCVKEFIVGDKYQVPIKKYNDAEHKILEADNISIQKIFDENELNKISFAKEEGHHRNARLTKNDFDVCLMD